MQIKATGVEVHIDGNLILQDIDFLFPAKASVAVIGVSGIGKTTLLKTIAGFLLPSKGEILIDSQHPRDHYKSKGIEFIFQEPILWVHLSVNKTLEFAASFYGKKMELAERQLILENVALGDKSACFPFQLSVGGRARLAIARCLCQNPKIILMDEPFVSVDPIKRLDLMTKIDKYREAQGITLVWTTHDIVEALRFSTHILALGGSRDRPSAIPGRVIELITVKMKNKIVDNAAIPDEAISLRNNLLNLIYGDYNKVL